MIPMAGAEEWQSIRLQAGSVIGLSKQFTKNREKTD